MSGKKNVEDFFYLEVFVNGSSTDIKYDRSFGIFGGIDTLNHARWGKSVRRIFFEYTEVTASRVLERIQTY